MQIWWTNWKEVVLRLVSLAAAYLTLVGVFITLPNKGEFSDFAKALMFVSLLAIIFLVVLEIRSARGRRLYDPSDKEGIKKYMHNWIDHNGRVAIWTRDMSWADNDSTRKLLLKKAKADELVICMPKITQFARELSSAGAEICTYPQANYDPKARFTIREYKRAGSRVAVGRIHEGLHVIEEHNSNDHPVSYLASDLVNLVRSQQSSDTQP